MDGIINVYKERGFTSFDVVAKLRGILHERRIGHTGTLDPEAEGVLPVCVGSATKACELLLDKEKEYEAVLLLGVETDTQDITGKLLKRREVLVGEEQAKEALLSFVGTYGQIPPMYSALKVNGKKLYDLAREGKTVERAPRPVTIYSIEILETSFPDRETYENELPEEQVLDEESLTEGIPFPEKTIRFLITCSKGTYIRTLCEDVGRKLGCGGCMKSLKRTRVSSFLEKDSHTLVQIEEICAAGRLEEILMPTDQLFLRYPAVRMRKDADKSLYNGNKLDPKEVVACEENKEEGEQDKQANHLMGAVCGQESANKAGQADSWFRVYDSAGRFLALYRYDKAQGLYRSVKMFLPH